MQQTVKILDIELLTHDVLKLVTEKPDSLSFSVGQAVDVSLQKQGWENELRPFTFTSLPEENHLEFIIKTYPAHNGVTKEFLSLKPGDALNIHDVFGEIQYKGEGVFIAGGAGVTPFIAIFKSLQQKNKIGNNKLIFANKTKSDIILEGWFNKLLGEQFINILSDEELPGYEKGFVSADLIKKYSKGANQFYYVCGPEPMMVAVEKHLKSLGISPENIVKEAY